MEVPGLGGAVEVPGDGGEPGVVLPGAGVVPGVGAGVVPDVLGTIRAPPDGTSFGIAPIPRTPASRGRATPASPIAGPDPVPAGNSSVAVPPAGSATVVVVVAVLGVSLPLTFCTSVALVVTGSGAGVVCVVVVRSGFSQPSAARPSTVRITDPNRLMIFLSLPRAIARRLPVATETRVHIWIR